MTAKGLNDHSVVVDDVYFKRLVPTAGALEDFSRASGNVSVYFRNLKEALLERIREHDGCVMVGCVAWFTDLEILKAVGQHSVAASFILNKENFLKDEHAIRNARRLYEGIHPFKPDKETEAAPYPRVFETISKTGIEFGAFRCCGRLRTESQSPWYMHNKFVVFCDYKETTRTRPDDPYDYMDISIVRPISVWTGSMNFTGSAGNHLENGLFIQDPEIAQAYFGEWGQVAALSEPLNWESADPYSDRLVPPVEWDHLPGAGS
ncbi:hypothetical protein [Sinorhizobium fredii]|uniref:hypothetical protein n=1 Tax=Rhizobium fredii TaxID=380 RepID=UPI000CF2F4F8|nr:hypothetical protein [Sinorhizobium fredii]